MFIGKWNKSVILTYAGMLVSLFGVFLCIAVPDSIRYAIACLMVAGVCDLFDGAIARKCKRTEEEKLFGIQLDSLVDVVDFIALPVAIFVRMGLTAWYQLLILGAFAVCGIARLAYFNITVENSDAPVPHYQGLPVTYSALIFPVLYLPFLCIDALGGVFPYVYPLLILAVAALNILNVKIKKPRGVAYIFFALLAIVMLVLYLAVL